MWCRQTFFLHKVILFILIFIGLSTLTGCTNSQNKSSKAEGVSEVNGGGWTITRSTVTRAEFNAALQKNSNAPFDTSFADSVRLEKAMKTIDQHYTDEEKELAKQELCKSPRCLTTFKAYYPGPDLLLFYIADNHFVKAAFVKASTGEMAQKKERINADYGVLSKNGYWVGLKREDSDNNLKLEFCRFVDGKIQSFASREFTDIDISKYEARPIFWGDDNTVYVAAQKLASTMPGDLTLYYAIRFTHEQPK